MHSWVSYVSCVIHTCTRQWTQTSGVICRPWNPAAQRYSWVEAPPTVLLGMHKQQAPTTWAAVLLPQFVDDETCLLGGCATRRAALLLIDHRWTTRASRKPSSSRTGSGSLSSTRRGVVSVECCHARESGRPVLAWRRARTSCAGATTS